MADIKKITALMDDGTIEEYSEGIILLALNPDEKGKGTDVTFKVQKVNALQCMYAINMISKMVVSDSVIENDKK